jgi:hypothetical protein
VTRCAGEGVAERPSGWDETADSSARSRRLKRSRGSSALLPAGPPPNLRGPESRPRGEWRRAQRRRR